MSLVPIWQSIFNSIIVQLKLVLNKNGKKKKRKKNKKRKVQKLKIRKRKLKTVSLLKNYYHRKR